MIAAPPPPPAPPLILIIPDARLTTLPAATAGVIRRCESAYHAGVWFVTVPAELSKEVTP